MAVYYKFKSAKDYDTVPIEGHFISVANLKDKIFESKHLGRGTDFDLVISNAQTNEEYLDEGTLVPKNTSVIVRRVPGRPRMPIVATEKKEEVKDAETSKAQSTPPKSSFQVNDIQYKYPDETEWDEFGTDLYALPEAPPGLQTATQSEFTSKADEDSKIKAFVDASASDWQRQTQDFPSRGFNRGVGGRNMGGRGYGRMMERKTPPQGYVCHRCKIPGHFIQHCPTNGDPNYDIKRVKPPTGIPKSMLVATPNGSYALPSGAVGVLRPNEAAFEKEVEGLPSSRSVEGLPSSRAAVEVPPELHCPLCKEVMKDAVLTSRCCLKSYCDKCIRDYIISKSMCVCGKTNVLADHLLPNKTLREAINRILENSTSSQENGGSLLQVQDMESERCPRPKAPSPSVSGCAKDSNKAISKSDVPDVKETVNDQKPSVNIAPPQITEKNRASKSQEPLDVTPESVSTKEPQSQESAPVVEEEVQQKAPVGEPARKKKKKRPRQFPNNDLQWRVNQDYGADSCIMPYAAAAYNPYWAAATQWGPESYLAGPIPYMGYGTGTCVVPPELYGAQGYMTGFVPPVNREYMDYSMNACNAGLAVMSREEFEARKADLRRKKENEQKYYGKDHTKDSVNDDDETASAKRMRLQHQASSHGQTKEEIGKSSERHRELEHPPLSPRAPGKRKAEREESYGRDGWHSVDSKINSPAAVTDADINKSGTSGRLEKKQKGSVFSRISFPEHRDEDLHIRATKKRNLHESHNGFREHERQLNVNKQQHYDDAKSLKKVINGRRGPYEDDLSDNDAAFIRNNSSHHRERSHDRESEKHSDSNNRISKHGRDHLVIKRG